MTCDLCKKNMYFNNFVDIINTEDKFILCEEHRQYRVFNSKKLMKIACRFNSFRLTESEKSFINKQQGYIEFLMKTLRIKFTSRISVFIFNDKNANDIMKRYTELENKLISENHIFLK